MMRPLAAIGEIKKAAPASDRVRAEAAISSGAFRALVWEVTLYNTAGSGGFQ